MVQVLFFSSLINMIPAHPPRMKYYSPSLTLLDISNTLKLILSSILKKQKPEHEKIHPKIPHNKTLSLQQGAHLKHSFSRWFHFPLSPRTEKHTHRRISARRVLCFSFFFSGYIVILSLCIFWDGDGNWD